MTLSLLKDQLLRLLQIIFLMFFLSAFYDYSALILIGTVLFFIDYIMNYRQYVLIIFNFYFLLFPSGLYTAVGYSRPTNMSVAALCMLVMYSISYYFINHIKSYRFTLITLFGCALFYLKILSPSENVQLFFKIAIVFWAYNFFLLIKEADHNKKKSVIDIISTLNAFWNYPSFLNSTYTYLLEHQLPTKESLRQARNKTLIMLAKSTPILILNNYLGYALMNKTFIVSDFQNHVFRLYYTTPAFDTLVNIQAFSTPALNYIFGIFGGGLIYISFLIYANVVTVSFLVFLGYDLPFKGFELSKIVNLGSYIHQIFYFYNHTLIYVFYPRLQSIAKTYPRKYILIFKKYKILPTVIIGGLFINLMTDYVVLFNYYTSWRILINTIWLLPYFIILSIIIYVSSNQNKPPQSSIFVSIRKLMTYSLILSVVFSFGRLLFTKKTFPEFANIYSAIFKYIYELFIF